MPNPSSQVGPLDRLIQAARDVTEVHGCTIDGCTCSRAELAYALAALDSATTTTESPGAPLLRQLADANACGILHQQSGIWKDVDAAPQGGDQLRIAVDHARRTSAALEATCRREEAQRPIVAAAKAWAEADEAWGNGETDEWPAAKLDGLRIALAALAEREDQSDG